MYQKIMNYELSDILGWFDAMDGEIDAYIGRMSSMLGAAVTQEQANSALEIMQNAGCEVFPAEQLQLGGKPAAWVLWATKR